MKGFKRRLAFPVLCLAVGLAVFGVSYTMQGKGPFPRKSKPVPGGQVEDSHKPALHEVIVGGNVEELKEALGNGADPNEADKRGNAALHWAIISSRINPVVFSQVKELLAHGANPGLANNRGVTPLHYAAMFGGTDAVASVLIDAGAPVNVVVEHVGSPYELALKVGNDGVASAISKSPGHVPLDSKKEATFKSLGDYSNALKEGFRSARTDEEREEVVTKATGRLVKAGVVGKAGAAKIRKELLKQIKNNNCTACEEE